MYLHHSCLTSANSLRKDIRGIERIGGELREEDRYPVLGCNQILWQGNIDIPWRLNVISFSTSNNPVPGSFFHMVDTGNHHVTTEAFQKLSTRYFDFLRKHGKGSARGKGHG